MATCDLINNLYIIHGQLWEELLTSEFPWILDQLDTAACERDMQPTLDTSRGEG